MSSEQEEDRDQKAVGRKQRARHSLALRFIPMGYGKAKPFRTAGRRSRGLFSLLLTAHCLLLTAVQNPPVNKRAKLSTCVKPIIVCNFLSVLPGTTT